MTVVTAFSTGHRFPFSASHWGRHWWNSCFSTAAVLSFKLKPSPNLGFYCFNTGWFGNKLHKTLPGCCTRSGTEIPRIWPNSKETLNLLVSDNSCPDEEEIAHVSLEHLHLHLSSWGGWGQSSISTWLLIQNLCSKKCQLHNEKQEIFLELCLSKLCNRELPLMAAISRSYLHCAYYL